MSSEEEDDQCSNYSGEEEEDEDEDMEMEDEDEDLEMEEESNSADNEKNQNYDEMILKRKNTEELPKNYNCDIVEYVNLKSEFDSKLHSLSSHFKEMKIEQGYFWNQLRKRNFFVKETKEYCNDHIFDVMDTRTCQELSMFTEKEEKPVFKCFAEQKEYPLDELYHLGCTHTYCKTCYSEIILAEIDRKGEDCIEMTCPHIDCPFTMTDTIVSKVLEKEEAEVFLKHLLTDFIKRSPDLVSCKGKNCTRTFQAPEKYVTINNRLPQLDTMCKCGEIMCLRCRDEGHAPLRCTMAETWRDDFGTLSRGWVQKTEKACPKCKALMKKETGYMHVTCKCQFEFCWLCLGDWKAHEKVQCNKFKPDEQLDEDDQFLMKVQFHLDRYVEHKTGYQKNDNRLRKYLEVFKEDSQEKIYKLHISLGGCMDFYINALKYVATCRKFISGTYPLAFNIQNRTALDLFQDNQYYLEAALERLDKFLSDHTADEFYVSGIGDKIYQSENFVKLQDEISMLQMQLTNQFKNAEKEFMSDRFLENILAKNKNLLYETQDKIQKLRIFKYENIQKQCAFDLTKTRQIFINFLESETYETVDKDTFHTYFVPLELKAEKIKQLMFYEPEFITLKIALSGQKQKFEDLPEFKNGQTIENFMMNNKKEAKNFQKEETALRIIFQQKLNEKDQDWILKKQKEREENSEEEDYLNRKVETDIILLDDFDKLKNINRCSDDDVETRKPKMPLIFQTVAQLTLTIQTTNLAVRFFQSVNSKIENKQYQQNLHKFIFNIQKFTKNPSLLTMYVINEQALPVLVNFIDTIYNCQIKNNVLSENQFQEHLILHQCLRRALCHVKTSEIRQTLFENGIIYELINKFEAFVQEKPRIWDEDAVDSDDEEELKQLKISQNLKKQNDKNDKKIRVRKGVGYIGQTTNWSSKDYFEKKAKLNQQVHTMVLILREFLDGEFTMQNNESQDNEIMLTKEEMEKQGISGKYWTAPKEMCHRICESSILTLLESCLRSPTILDLAKEFELYESYIKFIEALSKHENLVPCLINIDKRYKPSQMSSVHQLFSNLHSNAKLFVEIAKMDVKNDLIKNIQEGGELKIAQKMAKIIVECGAQTNENLSKSPIYKEFLNRVQKKKTNLSLREAYKESLKDFRFAYCNMKKSNAYNHHYASTANQDKGAFSKGKMVRLAQEIADCNTNLPISHENAIFIRADEERLDIMKASIFGAEGTPYAHGCFEYHLFFPSDYPQNSPKCNLETTGSGDVRFNPNLYHCGKVCLSLLGTWRGAANESWDPKFSSLIQLLISIQAVVMSEAVYFNEPGYERENGTQAGEEKNIAYKNIVRINNIKHAMIGQIKKPTVGFEEVVRRHFFLKKDEIMKTCDEWVKLAMTEKASYTGLVSSHNSKYCTRFNGQGNYATDLKVQIKELREILYSLEAPALSNLMESKVTNYNLTQNNQQQVKDITEGATDLDDIDVTYNDQEMQVVKGINIEDAGVKDRWSRYIGVMGMDAVKKQAKAQIFLSGLDSLGVETAKNLTLSGLLRLTLHDQEKTSYNDLAGQFFLGENDIGKNRAEACLQKIQQLNFYVKVDCVKEKFQGKELPTKETEIDELDIKNYSLVILGKQCQEVLMAWSQYCRKHNVKFIVADCYGVFSRIFCDFGKDFLVFDKNGEEHQEVMIQSISNEEKGVVTLLKGVKHSFEDGDTVKLTGIEGMNLLKQQNPESEQNELQEEKVAENLEKEDSINDRLFQVEVININSFRIGNTTGFSQHKRGGLAKFVKVPQKLIFKPYHEIWEPSKTEFTTKYAENLEVHDFMKFGHTRIHHLGFMTLNSFKTEHKRNPLPYNIADLVNFMKLAEEINKTEKLIENWEESLKLTQKLLVRFCMTLEGSFGPQAAFLGGMVAQETVKAITGKFTPINQLMFADSIEVLNDACFPDNILSMDQKEYQKNILDVEKVLPGTNKNRNDGLRLLIGSKLLEDIQFTKLFMIGAGAIGCELLKNYAMLGIGTGEVSENSNKFYKERTSNGQVILTDPDVIEVSNLNRQFLFREKHLRKPKSVTAAAAAQGMNPEMKNHLVARLDKVHEGSSYIFTDQFFSDMTVVTNALDNVKARVYIDQRCVTARTPLLESGTLGPKGHVQVILPFKTESYGSMKDPAEENDVPFCTLKMFPEETLHCVEWARDLFSKYFTARPKSLAKCMGDLKNNSLNIDDFKQIKEAVKHLKGADFEQNYYYSHYNYGQNQNQKQDFTKFKSFEVCVKWARNKFQKIFQNDIKQLMYVYPLDKLTKEGNLFWSLPKRPPTLLEFSADVKLHEEFIISMACLRAKVFNCVFPKEIRDNKECRAYFMKQAAQQNCKKFVPNKEKAKEIEEELEKEQNSKNPEKEKIEKPNKIENTENSDKKMLSQEQEFEKMKQTLTSYQQKILPMNIAPEEFEKDNDQNFHIDAIHSMANCRSSNYKLEPMDWMTVKIKAGRIIPALATTTASIAGLQSLELVKVIKGTDLEHMKNAFLNIAVPILTQSEPGPPPKVEVHEKLSLTVWDRWGFDNGENCTIEDLFQKIIERYGVWPQDVMLGSKPVYMSLMHQANEKVFKQKISETFSLKKGDYVDLTVTCKKNKESEKIVEEIPIVRVTF